jgi:hypothetical protein
MSKRKWHVGELPAIGQVHRNGWQVHVGRPPIDGLAAVGRPMRPGYDQVAEAAASQGGAWDSEETCCHSGGPSRGTLGRPGPVLSRST